MMKIVENHSFVYQKKNFANIKIDIPIELELYQQTANLCVGILIIYDIKFSITSQHLLRNVKLRGYYKVEYKFEDDGLNLGYFPLTDKVSESNVKSLPIQLSEQVLANTFITFAPIVNCYIIELSQYKCTPIRRVSPAKKQRPIRQKLNSQKSRKQRDCIQGECNDPHNQLQRIYGQNLSRIDIYYKKINNRKNKFLNLYFQIGRIYQNLFQGVMIFTKDQIIQVLSKINYIPMPLLHNSFVYMTQTILLASNGGPQYASPDQTQYLFQRTTSLLLYCRYDDEFKIKKGTQGGCILEVSVFENKSLIKSKNTILERNIM